MVLFVSGRHALKDTDSLFFRRFLYIHRLEPAFQCGVLFDIFPILGDGGGPDQLYFPSCQRRLQDIGGINRAFRTARTDKRMKLIQEQKDIAVIGHFPDHFFNALFKFTAVLASGYHSG